MSQLMHPLKLSLITNRVLRKFQPTIYSTLHTRYYCSKDNGDKDSNEASTVSDSSSTRKDMSSPSSKEDSDKKDKAKKRLFSLLSEFEVETSTGSRASSNLKLTTAAKRVSKKERFKDLKILTPQEKLQEAVKNVAESVSGDPDQTKGELNKKLSSLNLVDSETAVKDFSESVAGVDDEMKKNIMSSVEDVASTVTGVKDISSIKSKLTQRLMRLSVEDKSSMPNKSIDLLKGMKIEQRPRGRPKDEQTSRGRPMDEQTSRGRPSKDEQYLHSTASTQRPQQLAPKPRLSTVNIFQSPSLDIFTIEEAKVEEKITLWKRLEEKNLKMLVQFAPSNGFEEMIMWTEQGKHWKFPIDNEAEFEEENVGFHEHVFLERYLDGFPTKGPIRQFMELVCVGLSKNPYITAERKVENIDWFRNYFKEKEEVLKRHDMLG